MKTNAIDFIKEKIICQEISYGIDITTNLVKAWIGEFEELEKERRAEQDKFFKDFESSDKQYSDELFIPTKLYTSQEVKLITNVLLNDIISEWHESKFQKELIGIIRERLNEVK